MGILWYTIPLFEVFGGSRHKFLDMIRWSEDRRLAKTTLPGHCSLQWPFQDPIDWRYLPYIRPIFGNIPTKYGLLWYSTSILGSWRSPIGHCMNLNDTCLLISLEFRNRKHRNLNLWFFVRIKLWICMVKLEVAQNRAYRIPQIHQIHSSTCFAGWWLTYPSETSWTSSMGSGWQPSHMNWKIIQPCLKPPVGIWWIMMVYVVETL